MDLKQRIQEAMKAAMKSHEKERLGCIRMVQAAIKQREVDERIQLTDEDIISLLDKQRKNRRDSIQHFQAANRQDLVDKEAFEITVIEEFMPKPLEQTEIVELIRHAIGEVGASKLQDMGKVMNLLKPKLHGRADMTEVGRMVKEQLA